MTIRVFLVDDHEIVRRGLRELLEEEDDIEVTGEAGTYNDALTRVGPAAPNVAVLDVRLGETSGIELCRELKVVQPDVGCLMLTSFDDEDALFGAIMAGASGYLLKQIKGNDLVNAIRSVANNESLIDPKLTEQVLERVRRKQETTTDELAILSDQERRILDLIAEGLTNRQIAERMFLAEKTIKNYVSTMLSKLGMSRRTEAAVFATRLGQRKVAE